MSDAALAATAQNAAPAAPAGNGHKLWHDGSFSFKDLLDIVNPLQHIPIIGSIYRWSTGDEPSDGARIIGDGIYGGPIGLAASAVLTVATEDSSGHDLGEQVLASLFGPGNESPAIGKPIVVAAAAAPVTTPAAAPPPATPMAATPPVILDHPPIPLFRGAQALAAPTPLPAAPSQDPVAQAFLAQTAQLQRQVSAGRNVGSVPLNNHVIPLELTGNPLPIRRFAAPAGTSSRAEPQPSSGPGDGLDSSSDITQKMLEALDKYEKLRQQQESAGGSAGSGVDVSF